MLFDLVEEHKTKLITRRGITPTPESISLTESKSVYDAYTVYAIAMHPFCFLGSLGVSAS